MNPPVVDQVTLGISGTTAVTINLGQILPTEVTNQVSLTAAYTMLEPPGFPARPPAGVAFGKIETPGTFSSGTTISVFDFEAAAIVAAGGGVITGTSNP